MILRTFKTPTNVFIIGAYLVYGTKFGLTDDYSSFELKIEDKEICIESDGFFTILTEEELLSFIINEKFLEESDDPYEEPKIYEESGIVFLKNFIGDIEGVLLDDNDQEIDFKDLDYIYHNKHNSYDFVVSVPDTEFNQLEHDDFIKYCEVIKTIHNREIVITKILK